VRVATASDFQTVGLSLGQHYVVLTLRVPPHPRKKSPRSDKPLTGAANSHKGARAGSSRRDAETQRKVYNGSKEASGGNLGAKSFILTILLIHVSIPVCCSTPGP